MAIFELNAGNHAMKRALANALAINQVERIGDKLMVTCSANCLQPDGQNDNDWDQGLVFLNPSHVWLQPPGFVTRMVSRHYLPLLVESEVQNAGKVLDANAKRSTDGKAMALQVVNTGSEPMRTRIALEDFVPSHSAARVTELAGPLEAVNTSREPTRVVPAERDWQPQWVAGAAEFTFAPHSFTILQFR